jgi:hypothetical protein
MEASSVQQAEREGFEPSVRENPVHRISNPALSATQPSLRSFVGRSASPIQRGRKRDSTRDGAQLECESIRSTACGKPCPPECGWHRPREDTPAHQSGSRRPRYPTSRVAGRWGTAGFGNEIYDQARSNNRISASDWAATSRRGSDEIAAPSPACRSASFNRAPPRSTCSHPCRSLPKS